MSERLIMLNAALCPDGTILVSRHVHDYVTHVDTITGQQCMLDGGKDYVRYGGPVKLLTVYSDDPFEKKRLGVEWGTRGKNGDEPLRFVRICDMSSDHISAVLRTQDLSQAYRELFLSELGYRSITSTINTK